MNIFGRKPADGSPSGTKSGGLIVAAIAMASKTAVLVKFSKPLITIISMLASMIAYGLYLGPWFGVGLVVMLFIHEMGHIIAMRLKGIHTPAGPIFIPFFGALIFMQPTDNRETEAFVGIGGPLLGTIGALAAAALWLVFDSPAMLLVSYIGLILNLFNMFPVSPLDGGRITQVVSNKMKYLGMLGIVAYILYTGEPQLLIFFILVLDSFRMAIGVKPIVASATLAAMTVLFLFGYSDQSAWLNTLDVFLAAFFCVMYWDMDRRRKKWANQVAEMNRNRGMLGISVLEKAEKAEEDQHPDDRAFPSTQVRTRWFLLYLGLTLSLCGLLYVEHAQLPEQAKHHLTQ